MFQGIKKLFGSKKEKEQILAPVAGQAVPLSEVPDPAFAQEILGKGVAIQPAENEFRAPASGEVIVLFETGHAVSIRTESGADDRPCWFRYCKSKGSVLYYPCKTGRHSKSRRPADHSRYRADQGSWL